MRKIFIILLAVAGISTGMAQGMVDNSIINADLTRLLKGGKRASVQLLNDKSLVAYLPFNGNANDESGNNNNGQVRNASLTIGCDGTPNSAYQFGGPSRPASIRIPNSSSLRISNGWTFATFVMITSRSSMNGWGRTTNDGMQCIMAKSHDRSGFIIGCHLNGDKFNTWLGGMGQSWTSGISGNIPGDYLNKWVHVAYTYAGGTFKVYLNGKEVCSKNTNPDFSRANGQDMYLGKFSDQWYPFNGLIDEVRIYNRALSAEEISALATL